MGKINVWVAPPSAVSKSSLSRGTEAILESIDPQRLNAGLKALAKDLEQILDGVESKGGFRLNAIEVGVEVTAEAGLNLIGTMTVGGKAGLTLRFEKV